MDRIRVDVDPTAAHYMQKEIMWDRADLCTCKIPDLSAECYRGNIIYVLETPEESGTVFGYGTAIVHAICKRPVMFTEDQMRAAGSISSRWQFFNR